MYCLGMHTRIGKAAIGRFARENDSVNKVLARYVAEHRRRDAACMAAFYGDGAPVSRRLNWSQSAALEALGIEADMLQAGVPTEGIEPLLAIVRSNLDHLNAIRAELFQKAQEAQP